MNNLQKLLQQSLNALIEAQTLIGDWGSYASEYFQEKHGLQEDIDSLDPAINALTAALQELQNMQDKIEDCDSPKNRCGGKGYDETKKAECEEAGVRYVQTMKMHYTCKMSKE